MMMVAAPPCPRRRGGPCRISDGGGCIYVCQDTLVGCRCTDGSAAHLVVLGALRGVDGREAQRGALAEPDGAERGLHVSYHCIMKTMRRMSVITTPHPSFTRPAIRLTSSTSPARASACRRAPCWEGCCCRHDSRRAWRASKPSCSEVVRNRANLAPCVEHCVRGRRVCVCMVCVNHH